MYQGNFLRCRTVLVDDREKELLAGACPVVTLGGMAGSMDIACASVGVVWDIAQQQS